MAYNAGSLETSAGTLKFKAFVLVATYAVGFWFFATLFYDLHAHLHPIQSALRPEVIQAQTTSYVFIWALIGFIVGLFKCQKLLVEANTILCMVEQEKHLRVIAGVLQSGAISIRSTDKPPTP